MSEPVLIGRKQFFVATLTSLGGALFQASARAEGLNDFNGTCYYCVKSDYSQVGGQIHCAPGEYFYMVYQVYKNGVNVTSQLYHETENRYRGTRGFLYAKNEKEKEWHGAEYVYAYNSTTKSMQMTHQMPSQRPTDGSKYKSFQTDVIIKDTKTGEKRLLTTIECKVIYK